MTTVQKIIKYLAMAFAIYLIVMIFGGIFAALGLTGFFFGDGSVGKDMKDYTVSQDISSLKMNINAADLTIKTGEKFVLTSNLERLKAENKDGCLTINENFKFNVNYKGASLVLEIPEDFVFDKAEITTGAGKLTVETLSAGEVMLKLGAGEAVVNNLTALFKSYIDGGAGKITVNSGSLANLDLDMGVGELCLTSRLSGECELDYGVGNASLTLLGGRDEYRIDFEKGLGEARIDGNSVNDETVVGVGQNLVEIDGGVGKANVIFAES